MSPFLGHRRSHSDDRGGAGHLRAVSLQNLGDKRLSLLVSMTPAMASGFSPVLSGESVGYTSSSSDTLQGLLSIKNGRKVPEARNYIVPALFDGFGSAGAKHVSETAVALVTGITSSHSVCIESHASTTAVRQSAESVTEDGDIGDSAISSWNAMIYPSILNLPIVTRMINHLICVVEASEIVFQAAVDPKNLIASTGFYSFVPFSSSPTLDHNSSGGSDRRVTFGLHAKADANKPVSQMKNVLLPLTNFVVLATVDHYVPYVLSSGERRLLRALDPVRQCTQTGQLQQQQDLMTLDVALPSSPSSSNSSDIRTQQQQQQWFFQMPHLECTTLPPVSAAVRRNHPVVVAVVEANRAMKTLRQLCQVFMTPLQTTVPTKFDENVHHQQHAKSILSITEAYCHIAEVAVMGLKRQLEKLLQHSFAGAAILPIFYIVFNHLPCPEWVSISQSAFARGRYHADDSSYLDAAAEKNYIQQHSKLAAASGNSVHRNTHLKEDDGKSSTMLLHAMLFANSGSHQEASIQPSENGIASGIAVNSDWSDAVGGGLQSVLSAIAVIVTSADWLAGRFVHFALESSSSSLFTPGSLPCRSSDLRSVPSPSARSSAFSFSMMTPSVRVLYTQLTVTSQAGLYALAVDLKRLSITHMLNLRDACYNLAVVRAHPSAFIEDFIQAIRTVFGALQHHFCVDVQQYLVIMLAQPVAQLFIRELPNLRDKRISSAGFVQLFSDLSSMQYCLASLVLDPSEHSTASCRLVRSNSHIRILDDIFRKPRDYLVILGQDPSSIVDEVITRQLYPDFYTRDELTHLVSLVWRAHHGDQGEERAVLHNTRLREHLDATDRAIQEFQNASRGGNIVQMYNRDYGEEVPHISRSNRVPVQHTARLEQILSATPKNPEDPDRKPEKSSQAEVSQAEDEDNRSDSVIEHRLSLLGSSRDDRDEDIEDERWSDVPRRGDGVPLPDGAHSDNSEMVVEEYEEIEEIEEEESDLSADV